MWYMENAIALTQWNRRLVDQTIGVLESSRAAIDDAISRLKDMQSINPGGPTIGPAPDAERRKEPVAAA
jgi:hypothetical protein